MTTTASTPRNDSVTILTVVLALATFVLSSPVADGQARSKQRQPTKLTSKQRTALTKTFYKVQKAKSDAAREMLFPALFRYGSPGVDALLELRKKKGTTELCDRIEAESEHRLGLDLLTDETLPKVTWAPTRFSFGEIVLVKTKASFGGFQVLSESAVHEGKIRVRTWSLPDAKRKLTDTVGETKEIDVAGTKVASPIVPNSGYSEYDFQFEVGEHRVTLRYLGPVAFTHTFGDGVGYCYAGTHKPTGLKATDKKLRYVESAQPESARAAKRLQKYVFRTVDGCEELLVDTADQAEFASFEQVQVFIRPARRTSRPVVMVRFLEFDRVGLAEFHPDLFAAFLRRMIDVDPADIYLIGGTEPSLTACRVRTKNKWMPIDTKQLKRLVAEFPEQE